MNFPTHSRDARPVLVLGLIGFNQEQQAEVDRLLADRLHRPVGWRTGALSKADAWWIHGARAQLLGDGSLRIGAAEPGGRSVRLALADVSRPIAFAEPLIHPNLEAAYSFRLGDPASVHAVLDAMESRWLASTVVRRWFAARLVAFEPALTRRVYHLVAGERLLAVIDRIGEIGWLPGVGIGDLERADWVGRSSGAAFIPHAFHRGTIPELVWDYALRSGDDLLPARYRQHRIFFRRPPRVAPSLLGDEHLLVMRELVVCPLDFSELGQRTGLGSLQLAQALAALYLAGSITTTQRRAHQPRRAAIPAAASSQASLWSVSGRGAPAVDFTVPASLAPGSHRTTESHASS